MGGWVGGWVDKGQVGGSNELPVVEHGWGGGWVDRGEEKAAVAHKRGTYFAFLHRKSPQEGFLKSRPQAQCAPPGVGREKRRKEEEEEEEEEMV